MYKKHFDYLKINLKKKEEGCYKGISVNFPRYSALFTDCWILHSSNWILLDGQPNAVASDVNVAVRMQYLTI